MSRVSGRRLSRVEGILRGYSRCSVKGKYYPALIHDDKGQVEGVVYQDVLSSSWDRLDRFEGDMYLRRPVHAELNDGSLLSCATYVLKPEFIDQLENFGWDFSEFLHKGRKNFQVKSDGFVDL